MELKIDLARRIVSDFHSPQAGREAEEQFRRVFQRREQPGELETRLLSVEPFRVREASHGLDVVVAYPIKLDRLLAAVGLTSSVSEAGRKLREGAVSINGERWREPHYQLTTRELVVQVGRRHLKVVFEPTKK